MIRWLEVAADVIGAASLAVNILLCLHLTRTRVACRYCNATTFAVHARDCKHPDNPSNQ